MRSSPPRRASPPTSRCGVTLLRVDWNGSDRYFKPDAGKQWVSILVRYVALDKADFNASEDWSAVDQDDFDGGWAWVTNKPQLTDGHLRKGQTVQGWVSFEFAAGVRTLEVTYRDGMFGDAHTWVVKHRRK